MTNSDWISLGSAVATFLGVVVAAVAIWVQIRKLNEQLMLQHFADYTKRYQEIILQFPENINEASFVLASHPDYSRTMRQMRAYFDLCFEEWYLNQRKLLDKEIWNVWKSGMEAALSKPAFKQAWAQIKKDTNFGVAFEQYVESFNEKAA
ncbi:MAG: hypothetical protein C4528_01510 [Gammaproteobacteria bacterium]|nr:MAG: hypothetical protein C4528_01510 [Gammaproteobacteria bacterium]